ncbi:D-ribose pyranase [Mariniphaga sediminis]|uniref:D-ribose pyranase n=1 Tax=Mariniphaga sediminis TaxID=1628158 RepID=UPI003567BD22
MKEVGLINRNLAKIVAEQGHQDLLMVVDAGFPIPLGVETIDISLSENKPVVLDVLTELKKFYSVEKMIIAKETKLTNPTLFNKISHVWENITDIEVVDHSELKQISKNVKAVIRTGDFTAYGNVILVSGAGERWYCENKTE